MTRFERGAIDGGRSTLMNKNNTEEYGDLELSIMQYSATKIFNTQATASTSSVIYSLPPHKVESMDEMR